MKVIEVPGMKKKKYVLEIVKPDNSPEETDNEELYFEDLGEPQQEIILDLLASILKNG